MKKVKYVVNYEYSEQSKIWKATHNLTEKQKSVTLPYYISKKFYIIHHRKLTFMKRYGLDFNKIKSEDELYKLMTLSGFCLYIACKLLSQKQFRSGFRKQIHGQINKWLKGESKFDSPFTYRQEKALYTDFEAREYQSLQKAINFNYVPLVNF